MRIQNELLTREIYECQTASEFLRANLDGLREKRGQAFSRRAISRRLGIASAASLSMVLTGSRRLTPKLAEKCARLFDLQGPRREFFTLLVQHDCETDPEKKLALGEKVLFMRTVGQQNPLDWKQYVVLSEWYYSALFVLVGLPDFEEKPKKLANRLGKGIRAKQVEIAIRNLLEVGLLERRKGRLVQAAGPVIKSHEDVRLLTIQKYHRNMLRLAFDALSLPLEKREFSGLSFSMPADKTPLIKQRIRQFREEMDAIAASPVVDQEVFQLNIQFFPLTNASSLRGSE